MEDYKKPNNIIFAVLDVSLNMGLNSATTSKVFCINICCFLPAFIFCTTVVYAFGLQMLITAKYSMHSC